MTNDNTRLLLDIAQTIPAEPAINCAADGAGPDAPEAPLPDQGRVVNASSAISRYVRAAIADNTRRAYRQDLEDFVQWGGTVPCSPKALATYLSDRAGRLSPATLARRIVGIRRAHVTQCLPDPTKDDMVRTVLRGIRRVHGVAQRRVAPLLKTDVEAMVPCTEDLRGRRDRALMLLGFAAALRRSELAALGVEDVAFVREGLVLNLRRCKTDQEGQGRRIAVPKGRTDCCPVRAVAEWLAAARISAGPVFRPIDRVGRVWIAGLSAQSIALILKHHAARIGLDPATVSGHSLRAGLVTSAVQAGVPVHKIQRQTGHRSLEMLSRYIREASIFEGNASGALL